MEKEIDKNNKKNNNKKDQRLRRLLGVDLCACASGHQLKCCGVCRSKHRCAANNEIKCGEKYRIDSTVIKQSKQNKNKKYKEDYDDEEYDHHQFMKRNRKIKFANRSTK